ncbi:MAG: GIY-YIG nuclease family protein [Chloroflexi bacterium]|nr:GIY-YIG nuclease family protein [Chloroflexota bacterium]
MADPYTIRMFVSDGDPEGIRFIDRLNWTGVGVDFPRSKWSEARLRPQLQRTGVYILRGYGEDDADLPRLYIGQADNVANRIDTHIQGKDFWDWGIAFVSSNDGLNRAHVTWLEYSLIRRANEARRCHLDNGNAPQEPTLTEAEKADTEAFLREILRILPLVGLRAFEFPRPIVPTPSIPVAQVQTPATNLDPLDTVVVIPAEPENFERVFLGNRCWYAIRISGGMLDKIKYIAAYQTQPVSAITHYAPVERIERYGDEGKYKLIFSEAAKSIGPIRLDKAKGGIQGPRYTTVGKLQAAKKLSDLYL